MSSETEFANRPVHPSKCCRFCKKSLTCSGSKVPRVSVFNAVKNKELLAFAGTESVVLADVVGSLGHKLQRHEVLSDISCLTCARTLTRVYGTFTKLVSHSNGGIPSNTKRPCSNSPTGISPLSKRTREDGARAKSRRCLDLTDLSVLPEEVDKENSSPSAGISCLEDAMDAREVLCTESEEQQTAIMKVFVGYPISGKVSEFKLEKNTTRSIVKNAACGNNSALAKAMMKDRDLHDLIMVEVINEIKREIRMYSKDPECLLKLKSPGDIRKFSNESFYQQLLVKCPKLAVFIASICQPGNLKGNMPLLSDAETTNQFRNAVCMATSICLHQYNQQLSATHYRMSLPLLNGGAKALTLERCSHLGICMSHPSAIRIQKKASAPSNTKAASWKEDTLAKSLQINLLNEVLKEQHSSHIDLSRDKAESCNYFQEDVYQGCCAVLGKGDPHNSLVYPRQVVAGSVKEIEKSIVHYKLVTDNIDLAVQARHQSSSHQNKSLHWTHSFAVKNRVKPDTSLVDCQPQMQVKNLQMIQILPSKEEQVAMQSCMVTLVFRVICKYFEVYKGFKAAVIHHIPHKYSNEMKQKSKQCLLGLDFLNTNKSGDMAELLKKFQEEHVPMKEDHVVHKTIVHGDQLTEERARNVQWTFKLGETEADRLEGLECTFSEFHLKMCMYEVSNKIFVKEESAGEKGTSFAQMNRSENSNAKKGPTKDFNAFKDFHESETIASILAAWMEFTGMDSIDSLPTTRQLPDSAVLKKWGNEQKRDWLSKEVVEFLNVYVFTQTSCEVNEFVAAVDELDTQGRNGYPCRECGEVFNTHPARVDHERMQHGKVPNTFEDRDEFGYYICRLHCGKTYKTKQGRNRHERSQHAEQVNETPHQTDNRTDQEIQDHSEDCVHNYHSARLTFGLLMMVFNDSVKEGDSASLLKFLKVALLFLHTYNRVKYAYVVLLFLAKVYAILSEKLAFEVLHNRTFNNSGKAGGNVPLDLRMEHLNRLLKLALKQLASNISEPAAQRIAKSLSTLEDILSMIDIDCNRKARSGFHSSKHVDETVITITKDLHDIKAFSVQPGREYKSFKRFKRNLLHKLDYREFYSWASKLFAVWQSMYY